MDKDVDRWNLSETTLMELTTPTKPPPRDDVWHDIKVEHIERAFCSRVGEDPLDVLQSSKLDDCLGDPLSDSVLVDSVPRLCHPSASEKETFQSKSNETAGHGLSQVRSSAALSHIADADGFDLESDRFTWKYPSGEQRKCAARNAHEQ